MRFRHIPATLTAIIGVAATMGVVPSPEAAATPADPGIAGVVSTAGPDRSWDVRAWITGTGTASATPAGTARTDRSGHFRLRPTQQSGPDEAFYVTATPAGQPGAFTTLAAVSPAIPGRLTINERTTVATGYAMAQFLDGTSIAGRAPGVRGAAMMAANLADPVSGRLGTTLTSPPNGSATSTLGAFISLTNALAACTSGADGCGALRSATTTPLSGRPANLIESMAHMAKSPEHDPPDSSVSRCVDR